MARACRRPDTPGFSPGSGFIWDSNLETLCRNLHIDGSFDLIATSSLVGISKPDPRIFEHVLSSLGIPAREAVHVGDTLRDDVWGARASNVTPIWLRRPGMAGVGGGLEVAVEPGLSVVTSLAEVVELVIS